MGECEKSVCNSGMSKWCMVHCWIRTISILAIAIAAVWMVADRPQPRENPRMKPMKATMDAQSPMAQL